MIEQELKLMLTHEQYEKLLTYAINSVTFVNHYFVSRTIDSGDMIRLRQYDDSYTLTKKRRISEENDVYVSREYNYELSKDNAEGVLAKGLSGATATKLFDMPCTKYSYVGFARTLRTVIDIEGFCMELDKFSYLDCIDYEVEFESESSGEIDKARALVEQLVGSCQSSSSKSGRFLQAVKRSNQ